jgi:large subunit ribosomal protein L9
MKVILRENLENLGEIGDVVDVKDGYARNFLIPRKLAFEASTKNLSQLEAQKKQLEYKLEKEKRSAEKQRDELEKVSLTIQMKVGEDGKLFGSVTTQMIAEALKEKGFEIDRKTITIPEPIKALGIYTIEIRLHKEVDAKIKVWTVRE